MTAWVFIDLDGTLTDAAPGITAAIAHALAELGLPVPSREELSTYIGPALQETFPLLGAHDVDAALGHYRAHYNAGGMFDAAVYEGALEMLSTLRAQGFQLSLATAKPIAYAADITAHFGIAPLLDAEHGSELDGRRTDKRDLIAHILAETGADPSASFMLGDRMHDARGAIHNGVTPIGASWGFGARQELVDAGCAAIADRPLDVPSLIEALR